MITEDLKKQFISQVTAVKRILIAVPHRLQADTAGTATALALFLGKLKKEAEILASEDFFKKFPFLPQKGVRLQTTIAATQSLAVVVNTQTKPLAELSYNQEVGRVKIFLKSGGELFAPEDISFETERAPYDLIVLLGAQSLEDLGLAFEASAELFYNTVKINIDNHPGNKYFGGLNLVDINASSVSEIVFSLFEEFEAELLDEDISTSLLAGIISRTNSFQHSTVTPKSFLQASRLVAAGARQQEIVQTLFKNKPLPMLRLWGRALARLEDLGEVAVCAISQSDFDKAEAGVALVPEVIKELSASLSNKSAVSVLAQAPNSVKIFLALKAGFGEEALAEEFGAPLEHKGLLNSPFMLWEFELPQTDIKSAQDRLVKAVESLAKA